MVTSARDLLVPSWPACGDLRGYYHLFLGDRILGVEVDRYRASPYVRRHPHPVANRIRRPVRGGPVVAARLRRTPETGRGEAGAGEAGADAAGNSAGARGLSAPGRRPGVRGQ